MTLQAANLPEEGEFDCPFQPYELADPGEESDGIEEPGFAPYAPKSGRASARPPPPPASAAARPALPLHRPPTLLLRRLRLLQRPNLLRLDAAAAALPAPSSTSKPAALSKLDVAAAAAAACAAEI